MYIKYFENITGDIFIHVYIVKSSSQSSELTHPLPHIVTIFFSFLHAIFLSLTRTLMSRPLKPLFILITSKIHTWGGVRMMMRITGVIKMSTRSPKMMNENKNKKMILKMVTFQELRL